MITGLHTALRHRGYPGRGCIAAIARSGALLFGYFITGRSYASQQRRLVVGERDVTVLAVDGVEVDPLRHYKAAVQQSEWLVVGNGRHVETLSRALASGASLQEEWKSHTFEPDPPLLTPRIWMSRKVGEPRPSLHVGAAWCDEQAPDGAARTIETLKGLDPGEGVLLTTYGRSLSRPAASPRVERVAVSAECAPALLSEFWSAIDSGLRVAAIAGEADAFLETACIAVERKNR